MAERREPDDVAVDVGDKSGVDVVDAQAVIDAERQVKAMVEAVRSHKMKPEKE